MDDAAYGLLGSHIVDFVGLTLILLGAGAFMTGRAIAITWRPQWQVLPYGLLLGLTSRFFSFALFQGDLLSIGGFLINTAVLTAIAYFAFRLTRAYKMVRQYPWAYERDGLFGWKDKTPAA